MIRVLFVCTGNICRSPAAEGVFKKFVEDRGHRAAFDIDSAGTIDYHAGENADNRMRAAAFRRGYELTSIARGVKTHDFEEFDVILAMDRSHHERLLVMERSGQHHGKVKLFLDFHPAPPTKDVPDPYYGGPKGFEDVLDLIEQSCEPLLAHCLALRKP